MSEEPAGTPPTIVVLGLGNVLRSDDGIGVHLARALAEEAWPPSVRVLDAGTPGLALLDLMEGGERVVILDACQLDSPPGSVHTFTPDEVRSRADQAPLSLHQADVLGALRLGQAVGMTVPVTLVGIQPASLDPGTELSPELTQALPDLLARIRELLRRLSQGDETAGARDTPSARQ